MALIIQVTFVECEENTASGWQAIPFLNNCRVAVCRMCIETLQKELIPEVVDILSENDLQFTTLRGTQDTVLSKGRREHDILKLLQFSQDR